MTRGKCKEVLQALWRYKDCGYSENEIRESLDMAIKALEQEPCEDAVNRSQALKELEESAKYHANDSREEMLLRRDRDIIKVRPKGHWIMTSDYLTTAYGSVDYVKCSCCGEDSLEEGNYCPNCGAKMLESQESEDKE